MKNQFELGTFTLSTGLVVTEGFCSETKKYVYLDAYNHLECYGKIDYKKLFKHYKMDITGLIVHDDMTVESEKEEYLVNYINWAIRDFKSDTALPYTTITFPSGVKMIVSQVERPKTDGYLAWVNNEIKLNYRPAEDASEDHNINK